MKVVFTPVVALLLLTLGAGLASAKLPAPSDEAKAKAAEAAAKTAHTGKSDAFKLCKSMDKVAAAHFAAAKKAGIAASAAVATPPCADPGPFVYVPASAPVAGSAPAAAVAAASAPAAVAVKK
ncbi:MAG: hypothetical protein AB9M53_04415 [Leptothrix sp. (in: b-proteobacteria)]